MVSVRSPRTLWTILFLIAICLLGLPAYAKYSGGTGEPNDPYQIATAEDLMLLGETPADYDKHFILTADIDLDPNPMSYMVDSRAYRWQFLSKSRQFCRNIFSLLRWSHPRPREP